MNDAMFTKQDQEWMKLAILQAKKGEQAGEVPIGAVLINQSNQLISLSHNKKEILQTPIGHAEILALHQGAKKYQNWRLNDCTLYVTLEPCAMCAGALVQARVKRLVFGARDPKGGACKSLYEITSDIRLNHRMEVEEGLFAETCGKMLTDFFRLQRKSAIKLR